MMEADRAVNLLEHQKEIHARPARQWIVSQQRKVRFRTSCTVSLRQTFVARSNFNIRRYGCPAMHRETELNSKFHM